jgi:hypothetical protein
VQGSSCPSLCSFESEGFLSPIVLLCLIRLRMDDRSFGWAPGPEMKACFKRIRMWGGTHWVEVHCCGCVLAILVFHDHRAVQGVHFFPLRWRYVCLAVGFIYRMPGFAISDTLLIHAQAIIEIPHWSEPFHGTLFAMYIYSIFI